ncbi:phosphogluconate dehydratase [Conexibacter stalactiti]|uniref:Phosphogluconate dehydratase n=2 Tax=Conexibacter stalactiti TaxID=1940611 RepID=A0ABU4HUC8_9ACTN|nr:phosphogluconate dehydratase [Conexibacter stalactiti]MDW5596429.1 phosphogluconate dehydratase [Conexibacter stalactiti]MEC5037071.1 phosphogluconate dehydratase [Conexibacter stalactiti]
MNPTVAAVTERIAARSARSRGAYLERIRTAVMQGPARGDLGCANFAHGFAACAPEEKALLRATPRANVAIVSSYNDMLSAHQPYVTYPQTLKRAVMTAGGVAQFAGGVPAMCDGITQGRAGMELSLFSRDVIAMSTAVALAHDMFDGALLLGICDKIVPGLLIGALSFGHLPALLVPAGPMPSGLPNREKSRIRQQHAQGLLSREDLLDAEASAYHAPGTCTFFGTANSNQLVVEAMGLQLPGSAFVNPGTPLRRALTEAAGRRVAAITALGDDYTPIGEIVDERAIVNGVVALLATGGSTNHTLHLVAIAAAAGIRLEWSDFDELSRAVPLLARIYPNGSADVNHFHAAGGTSYLISELLAHGLMHEDVKTVAGRGLRRYAEQPVLEDGQLSWAPVAREVVDASVLRSPAEPFSPDGGLRLLGGSLGSAVVKISAVAPEHRVVRAPARVFDDQAHLLAAFDAGELDGDLVAVVRFQGPRANGMPELHKLTPPLGILQDRGHAVALVTDGRMSGASGRIPAAIHCTPEARDGGPLARLRDGDLIELDCEAGTLDVIGVDLAAREPLDNAAPAGAWAGTGRDLFDRFRDLVGRADEGASVIGGAPAPAPAVSPFPPIGAHA